MFKNIKKVIQKIQTASVSEIFNSKKDGNLDDLKNALSETELIENNIELLNMKKILDGDNDTDIVVDNELEKMKKALLEIEEEVIIEEVQENIIVEEHVIIEQVIEQVIEEDVQENIIVEEVVIEDIIVEEQVIEQVVIEDVIIEQFIVEDVQEDIIIEEVVIEEIIIPVIKKSKKSKIATNDVVNISKKNKQKVSKNEDDIVSKMNNVHDIPTKYYKYRDKISNNLLVRTIGKRVDEILVVHINVFTQNYSSILKTISKPFEIYYNDVKILDFYEYNSVLNINDIFTKHIYVVNHTLFIGDDSYDLFYVRFVEIKI